MACKRKREVGDRDESECEVSEIDAPMDNATIHGVITELSPVKVSRKNSKCKYFNGAVIVTAKRTCDWCQS